MVEIYCMARRQCNNKPMIALIYIHKSHAEYREEYSYHTKNNNTLKYHLTEGGRQKVEQKTFATLFISDVIP